MSLIGKDFSKHLEEAFNNANSLMVVSAYLTMPAVDFLFDKLPLGVPAKFVVRARPEDILSGSCDLDAIKTMHFSGINCYLNREVHAKLYVIDQSFGFIGSANFTNNGLRLAGYGNLELSTKIDISTKDLSLIETIIKDSIPVTADLIKKLEIYKKHNATCDLVQNQVDSWWDKLLDLQEYNVKDGLYVTDLPWIDLSEPGKDPTAIEHDQDVFHFGSRIDALEHRFKASKIFNFVRSSLQETEQGCLYFGELTALVHSALKDDVLPYRSEIKEYIVNLISYLQLLAQDQIVIDRPNYSQRIALK
ncbi:phospholipase D family protein [Vibrio breoganii]